MNPSKSLAALAAVAALSGSAAAQERLPGHEEIHELREANRDLRERVAELEARVADLEEVARRLAAVGEAARRLGAPAEPAEGEGYFDADGEIPAAEQVPGYPWLRKVPGLTYARPRPIPHTVYARYRDYDALVALFREAAGGEFVEAEAGRGYRLEALDPGSVLATRLGLRPGDLLLEVNGRPLDAAVEGRELFVRLRDALRFALLIEREGQRVLLSYYVGARGQAAGREEADAGPADFATPAPLRPEDVAERYALVMATVPPGAPERSTVILADRHTGAQRAFGVGDDVDGFVLRSIAIEGEGDARRAVLLLADEAGAEREITLERDR